MTAEHSSITRSARPDVLSHARRHGVGITVPLTRGAFMAERDARAHLQRAAARGDRAEMLRLLAETTPASAAAEASAAAVTLVLTPVDGGGGGTGEGVQAKCRLIPEAATGHQM